MKKVHLAFIRSLLGVRQGTVSNSRLRQATVPCNRVVLAEMGRWPLALRWYKRIAKFYNGLLDADEGGLLARSLSVSCQLALGTADSVQISRRPWAGQIAAAFQKVGINMDLESRSGLNLDTVITNWKAFIAVIS